MRKELKYKNIRYKGFHSKKEYSRSNELKLLEKAGVISHLQGASRL